jgi:hypothetical protein
MQKLSMPKISFPLGSENDPELKDCVAYRVNSDIFVDFNYFVEEFTNNLLRRNHLIEADTDNEDAIKKEARFSYLNVSVDALRELNHNL